MKTILILGAAGFLGSNLTDFFLKKGYHVIGVDNFCTGSKNNILDIQRKYPNNFTFYDFDICGEWTFLDSVSGEILSSLEYVFHFASAASPKHYQKLGLETLWVNTIGLKNALTCADTYNAKVIFASTSEVYGDSKVFPQSETYWGNVNPFGERSCYDEAKRMGEALIYTWNKKYGTKHGLVRIFNTYGPGMNPNDGRAVIQFILQALAKAPLTIYGSGFQTRSFCYVDDLIDGIDRYAALDLSEPLNLGNDFEITILDLAKTIIDITNSDSKIIYEKLPSDDPIKRIPDLSLALNKLNGWKPQVSLLEGLKRMIETIAKDKDFP